MFKNKRLSPTEIAKALQIKELKSQVKHPEKYAIFIVTIHRVDPKKVAIDTLTAIISASSKEEALDKAKIMAEKAFPKDKGYENYVDVISCNTPAVDHNNFNLYKNGKWDKPC